MNLIARLRCWWKGSHDAKRQPLGGFRCSLCGLAGADLYDMGYVGYVSIFRTTFSREPHQELTRTTHFEKESRVFVPRIVKIEKKDGTNG